MSTQPQRTFLGHPLGLYVLFFTEMWERFSYYGMRALLLLYMVNYFKWSQKDASTVYKVYTSFVYVTPILGGFLADRLLGNRMAVIIGAVLMAVGHFLMAFEQTEIFYMALIFLIFGNGFFKPNMSTQVGRLYPANDGRRDGAYTIFYMGINLGAFIAPLLCGWLQENTVGGYHSGFTMAGIGMVLGLVIYLLGQPLIMELPPNSAPIAAANSEDQWGAGRPEDQPKKAVALSEAEAENAPSSLGFISAMSPVVLPVLGLISIAAGCFAGYTERLSIWDAIMAGIGGMSLILVGYVCSNVKGGVRDRVLTILALGVFVIFFWGAFEQAGNVLNLWADKSTNRYLSEVPPEPALYPELPPVVADEEQKQDAAGTIFTRFSQMFQLKPAKDAKANEQGFAKSVNPVPTTWFQAVNALAIFTIAPLFAWMWVVLDRRGMQPSIPLKMTIGLLLVSASVAVMIAGATQEHKPSSQVLTTGALPEGITVKDGLVGFVETKGEGDKKTEHFEPFHAGRLRYNEATKTLEMMGVLPDNERDRIIEKTAPADYVATIKKLEKQFKAEVEKGKAAPPKVESASVELVPPPGFDLKFAGLPEKDVVFKDGTLTANKELAERDVKGLLVSGGAPEFRSDIHALYAKSAKFRVTPLWLIYSYILATLGELCLSPVGLSMVSKLAPAKYATMLMGVWMLTSSFGNFAAGLAGEQWGLIPPVTFFTVLAVAVAIAATVLFTLVNLLVKAMHGVN